MQETGLPMFIAAMVSAVILGAMVFAAITVGVLLAAAIG